LLIGSWLVVSDDSSAAGQTDENAPRRASAEAEAASNERAEGSQTAGEAESSPWSLNLRWPTLGGRQFWTDWQWRDGWRVQQNALSEHWRLLSPANVRYAWGSRELCLRELQAQAGGAAVTPDERIVVLLHGLMRSSASMQSLAAALEQGGIERPVCFEYASSRRSIADHAVALRHWLEHLPGRPRIDFVAHSMGNIVIRHLMADLQRDGDPEGLLPRFGKMVMLGPPNQGSEVARQLGRLGLFELLTGRGGMELGPAWDAFQHRLAVPSIPFIIIAGEVGNTWLRHPLVSGPNDLIVAVDETRLPGAERFHRVTALHSLMMNDAKVQQIVMDFLGDEGHSGADQEGSSAG
jgi:hypothetical protein